MKSSDDAPGGARRGHRLFLLPVLGGSIAGLLLLSPIPAEATHHAHHRHTQAGATGFAPAPVSESILLDADTGKVLSETNADALTYPASLTKLMTLYLTFEDLNSGRIRLDQYFPVSALAASQSPTKLGLRPGDSVQVQDLILGVVTRSANDAAVVLAEGLGGSEAAFADRMTRKARQLGLTATLYRNASGLPDPEQHTTARDVAQLALALLHDFPQKYRYFSTRRFDFRGRIISNHNHLLDWYAGADGIKTGYIRASGFNLAASAVRDGHRLIGVIMGGPSAGTRDREMGALLDHGFAELGVPSPTLARRETSPAPPRATVAAAGPAPPRAKPSLLTKAAARLAVHLSPVSKADAAVLPRASHEAAAPERWGIQLGAFHAESSAEKAGRAATGLAVAKGKRLQIVETGKTAKARLYRARLTNFTPREAQSACAALRKKGIECAVVPPAGLKVAVQW
ncbi:MAG TPA: D-alanyl-D-alanine carboxypeptidase [Stellaceae bacterium]|nr:D-alanyl-D-alanine carboxypeptidase [Stellaceae bacterium]